MKITKNPVCPDHPKMDVLAEWPTPPCGAVLAFVCPLSVARWRCMVCHRVLGCAAVHEYGDLPFPQHRVPTLQEQRWRAMDWEWNP